MICRVQLLLLSLLWCYFPVFCQEFNASVKVNADQVEGTSREVFESLEADLNELINTRVWSDLNVATPEKISCTFQLNVTAVLSPDRYAAELIVQSRRPVYQSVYQSSVFNFRDTEFEFNYVQHQPLSYTEHHQEHNLVAVVGYYLYLMLGMDLDTFAPMGGTAYYERAAHVVTQAQGLNEKGWTPFDRPHNRHGLVTAMLEQAMEPYRILLYQYHRQGLDAMAQSVDKGRHALGESLQQLQVVDEANSMSVLLTLFIDAKLDELINVYSKAPQRERQAVYDLLFDLYPAHSQRLAVLKRTAH